MPSQATLNTLIASINTAFDTALAVAPPNELDKNNAEAQIKLVIEKRLHGMG